MDLFKAAPGEHMMFDLRRVADEAIAKVGIESVHVLQGAFMDMFRPGGGMFDCDAGVVQFWGDGHQIIDCISVESTAAMVAHAAFDSSLTSGNSPSQGTAYRSSKPARCSRNRAKKSPLIAGFFNSNQSNLAPASRGDQPGKAESQQQHRAWFRYRRGLARHVGASQSGLAVGCAAGD